MAKPIPNIEYLGTCYDAVRMDPLSLASTALPQSVFDLSETSTVTTSIGAFDVPKGVTHHTVLKENYDSVTGVISSANEFQDTFKRTVEVDAGVKGAFEFTGSQSYKNIKKETQSRKRSFVYTRAVVEIHSPSVDIADLRSGLKLGRAFRDAVANLPAGVAETSAAPWKGFIQRFGTHFTWNITLGGIATQRTTGLTSKFLKSEETEEQLKAKAKLVIDKVTAGASVDQAQASVRSSDDQDQLERTRLEFQGGIGSLTGINGAWRTSLSGEPTIISAKLKRISELLNQNFFPGDASIDLKHLMLDYGIDEYIHQNGEPALIEAPLEYGESILLTLPWTDGKTLWPPIVAADAQQQPSGLYWFVQNGAPGTQSPQPANVALESTGGHRGKRPILAGDEVFFRHVPSGRYLSPDPNPNGHAGFTNNKNDAARCVILHAGDNVRSPARLGEYFAETDLVSFSEAPLGSRSDGLGVAATGRYLCTRSNLAGFKLIRWDSAALEADDD
jgi:MAC/Perforin domain